MALVSRTKLMLKPSAGLGSPLPMRRSPGSESGNDFAGSKSGNKTPPHSVGGEGGRLVPELSLAKVICR